MGPNGHHTYFHFMKLAIQDTKLNILTAFNSTTSSALTMQGVIPSEKQQHSYNVKPGLQRTDTTELPLRLVSLFSGHSLLLQ